MKPHINIWKSDGEDDRLLKDVQEGGEEPLYSFHYFDEVYVDKEDGTLKLSLYNGSSPLSVHGSISISGSEADRALASDIMELTGKYKTRRVDDRGRVTIGTDNAGKTVKVAVIGEVEEGGR